MNARLNKARLIGMPANNWLVLLALATLYYFLFDFLRIREYDSPAYIGASRLLFGLSGGYEHQARIAKPVVLLLPGLFEIMTGKNPAWIFILQNFVAFLACGWLMHSIAYRLVNDEGTAFLVMLCFALCQPFAVYSLLVLADAPGWAWELLVIRLALDCESFSWIKKGGLGLLIGLGFLVKESMLIAALFVFLNNLLFDGKDLLKKLKSLLNIGLPALLVMGLNAWFVKHFFHVNLLGWIVEANEEFQTFGYNLHYFQQVLHTLDLAWLYIIAGTIFALRKAAFSACRSEHKAALITSLFFFLSAPLLANFAHDRVLFMASPFLFILTLGYIKQNRQMLLLLIPTFGFSAVLTTYLIYRFEFQNLLPWYYLSGIALFIFWELKKSRQKSLPIV